MLQTLAFIAGVPFLYFVVTRQPPNAIYYAALFIILVWAVFKMLYNYTNGHKQKAYKSLAGYGIIIAICAALTLLV